MAMVGGSRRALIPMEQGRAKGMRWKTRSEQGPQDPRGRHTALGTRHQHRAAGREALLSPDRWQISAETPGGDVLTRLVTVGVPRAQRRVPVTGMQVKRKGRVQT